MKKGIHQYQKHKLLSVQKEIYETISELITRPGLNIIINYYYLL